jgi:hypothetical protein
MWIAECDLDQVRSLFEDPERWMWELSAAAGKKLILRSPFMMKIRLLPTAAGVATPNRYLVQGIHDTNIITIRPKRRDNPPLLDLWDSHWQQWINNTPLVVGTFGGVGYGHLELTDINDAKDVRADKVAAFLIRSATGALTSTGQMWLDHILAKPPVQPQMGTGGLTSVVTPVRAFAPITTEEQVAGINFVYSGEFGATDIACDNKAGNLDQNGQIVLDDVTVKTYPPPTP